MSEEVIISQEGDTVDLIAFNRFGRHGLETAILDANPGLAALGPVIPIGTRVIIPLPATKDRRSSTRLWGS
jgi:phage tail protein X